jgi:hypothetical protein
MKNWLKQQFTEVSAWAGFLLILSHWMPFWLSFSLGVLAISIDDDKARQWCLKVAPWLGDIVDDVHGA